MTSQLIPKMLTIPQTCTVDSNTLFKIYQVVTNNQKKQSVYNPPRSRKVNILNDY